MPELVRPKASLFHVGADMRKGALYWGGLFCPSQKEGIKQREGPKEKECDRQSIKIHWTFTCPPAQAATHACGKPAGGGAKAGTDFKDQKPCMGLEMSVFEL